MVAATALLTGPGQELLARLAGMDVGPDRVFAVSEALRAEYPAELVAAALTQQCQRFEPQTPAAVQVPRRED